MKNVMTMFLVMLMIYNATVFGAMPDRTVVIGEKAFSLNYANDDDNINEIREAMKASKGKIYIKARNIWYKNDNSKLEDLSVIPGVVYKPGEIEYEQGDGERIEEELILDNKKIKIDDGQVSLFSRNDNKWYQVKENTISNLNERCYKLLRVLSNNNTRKNYIDGYYGKGSDAITSANISLTSNEYDQVLIFEYSLFDNQKNVYAGNSNVYLRIAQLSDEETGAESTQSYYYTPYYVEKLKESIKVVFYDKDYTSITKLVMDKYEKYVDYREEGIGDKMFKDTDIVDEVKIISERTYNGFEIYFEL